MVRYQWKWVEGSIMIKYSVRSVPKHGDEPQNFLAVYFLISMQYYIYKLQGLWINLSNVQGVEYVSLVCLIPVTVQENHHKTISWQEITEGISYTEWLTFVINFKTKSSTLQLLWSFYSIMCSRNIYQRMTTIILWVSRMNTKKQNICYCCLQSCCNKINTAITWSKVLSKHWDETQINLEKLDLTKGSMQEHISMLIIRCSVGLKLNHTSEWVAM